MKYLVLDNLPEAPVSHNCEIKKKVMVVKGELPSITQFARTVFKPGQVAPAHVHKDMYEIFYTEEGSGNFILDGKSYQLSKGICIFVEPGESHEVENNSLGDLVLLVLGVEEQKNLGFSLITS